MRIYRLLSILFFPLIALYLLLRLIKKKEDKNHLKERFGYSTVMRPRGDLIWIHAVSVGEVNSAMILIEELLRFLPKTFILFTSTTLTSAAIIATRLPNFKNRVIHQFLPVDSYFCIKNFFDFWRPRVAIFVESEIWPNMLLEAHKRTILTFLVNARMSQKSFKKWSLAEKFGFGIFNYFSAIFAQTKDDQKHFSQLTNREVFFYGNLKSEAQTLPYDADKLEKLESQIEGRKFWLAASTHRGEEEIIIKIHQRLKKEFKDLLTIIVPRHPERAEEIKVFLNELNFAQRSKNESIRNSTEIYLADSLNELGIFYRLAPFAFIGGSLVKVGGHNPFEAVKLGCAVISGREVFNFKEIYDHLREKNSCMLIGSDAELTDVIRKFLTDEDSYKKISTKASQVLAVNSGNIAEKIVRKFFSAIPPKVKIKKC